MRPYKKPNEKICPFCKKEAEDEKHFLISCSVYQEKRKSLFECLSKKFKLPIVKMSTENIFLLLLNPPSNNADNVNIATELVNQVLVEACKTAGLKSQNKKTIVSN